MISVEGAGELEKFMMMMDNKFGVIKDRSAMV